MPLLASLARLLLAASALSALYLKRGSVHEAYLWQPLQAKGAPATFSQDLSLCSGQPMASQG